MSIRVTNTRGVENVAIGHVLQKAKEAKETPKPEAYEPMVRIHEESDGMNHHSITTKCLKRVEKDDYSCRCLCLVRSKKTPDLRCGMCGSAVIHPYHHTQLVPLTAAEVLQEEQKLRLMARRLKQYNG